MTDQQKVTLKDATAAAHAARARVAEAAEGLVADARERVSDLASAVTSGVSAGADKAGKQAGIVADAVADAGHKVSDGLRQAMADIPPDSFAARALDLAATGLTDLARRTDGTTVASVFGKARDTVRRHPVLAAAGAAVAGFALMRMIKAGPAASVAVGAAAAAAVGSDDATRQPASAEKPAARRPPARPRIKAKA